MDALLTNTWRLASKINPRYCGTTRDENVYDNDHRGPGAMSLRLCLDRRHCAQSVRMLSQTFWRDGSAAFAMGVSSIKSSTIEIQAGIEDLHVPRRGLFRAVLLAPAFTTTVTFFRLGLAVALVIGGDWTLSLTFLRVGRAMKRSRTFMCFRCCKLETQS